MMEFRMTTDMATALPAEIGFNFEELKAELTERLSYYNALVVTEDTVKEGKADRANLNKLRDAIEARRKEVKRQCMAPYTAFEAKVKELTALIDAPIAAIDTQLKKHDEIKKQEKMQAIRKWYTANVNEYLQTIIPLERIQRSDWLNAAKTMKRIQMEIAESVAKVTADLEVLNKMPTDEYTAAVRAKYMETLNITATLAYRTQLQQASETFAAGFDNQVTQEAEPATEPTRAPERVPVEQPSPTDKLYELRLRFELTMAQANALKKFLADNHINYEKI